MGTACPAGAPTATSISEALTNPVPGPGTLILVGPGSYTDGPYVLPPGVSLQGSGAGVSANATMLTLLTSGSQTYVTTNGGNVSDLRVSMTLGNGATGVAASGGSILDHVVVFGVGATSSTGVRAQGATLQDTTVNVTDGVANTGVSGTGVNTLRDSTWNGGTVAYRTTGTDTVSRVIIRFAETAVSVEGGTLSIDDSLLDLGTAGTTGLLVRPAGTEVTAASANHLTVVGGAAGSRGVVANASAGPGRTAELNLNNSIVRGPTTSLQRVPGASGTATFTVNRSDYENQQGGVPDGVGNLDVDPAFVDGAGGNYHLRAASPVVDKGAASAASKDLDDNDRSFDGDRDGIPVPDMGAYELRDVTPPTSVITGGPSGPTNDNTPVFTFRSGPDVTFQCQLDGSGFQPCSSPVTTTPLADGVHSFTVRGTDPVFNVEGSPPTRRFTVDTVAPDTRFTKKAPKRLFRKKVKFKFASSEAGARFQCKLDRRPWRSCGSTFKFGVKRGKHTILVRAVDKAGNTDKTPARYKFKRLKRR